MSWPAIRDPSYLPTRNHGEDVHHVCKHANPCKTSHSLIKKEIPNPRMDIRLWHMHVPVRREGGRPDLESDFKLWEGVLAGTWRTTARCRHAWWAGDCMQEREITSIASKEMKMGKHLGDGCVHLYCLFVGGSCIICWSKCLPCKWQLKLRIFVVCMYVWMALQGGVEGWWVFKT